MSKTGRPTIRTDAIVDEVLERIAEGQTLASICREEGKPKPRTWYDWCEADADLSARFARARRTGFDAIAEEALEIADDGRRDYVQDDEGAVRVDHDHVQRSKLRIETRLKLLAKWDPKRYGERLALAGDTETPLMKASDDQIDARIRELLGKGG